MRVRIIIRKDRLPNILHIRKDTHDNVQPKRDLLAMNEADREAFTEQVKEYLALRAEQAKLDRQAHAFFEHF